MDDHKWLLKCLIQAHEDSLSSQHGLDVARRKIEAVSGISNAWPHDLEACWQAEWGVSRSWLIDHFELENPKIAQFPSRRRQASVSVA